MPEMAPEAPPAEPVAPEEPENPYGANNEELPPELQAELKRLVDKFTLEDSISRREEVRQIRKAREFWRGRQYLYWSEKDQAWKQPQPTSLQPEDPLYQYVTNIYQAYGLSFIAAITQSPLSVEFWPQSPSQQDDVQTAKAATAVSELIQRNNRINKLRQDIAFYLWTDGTACSYTRYVADGARFGVKSVSKLGQQQMEVPGQPGVFAPQPVVVGVDQIENGQEEISILGRLEVKLPNYCKEREEYPYIQWSSEVHKTKLAYVYKHVADKIISNSGAQGDDTYERNARIGLTTGSRFSQFAFGGTHEHESLVTFRRTWLRPFVFEAISDQALKTQLLEIFPDGAYVAFAGDQYCESRNEKMDDHWRICHGMPGDGQLREAVGGALISIQEQVNTMSNIQTETYEHGIPTTFYAARAINGEAWAQQGNRPGAKMPVATQPGETVRGLVDTTQAGTPPESLIEYTAQLFGPIPQFIAGLHPALFGADAGNDTASGYAMQRDQAMGRIGLVYRSVKEFYAETMLLAVECFRKNRQSDVEMAVLGPSGKFDSKFIHLDELRGNIFAYPEAEDDFPISWTTRKNTYTELANTPNPVLQGVFGTPANMAEFSKTVGLRGLKLPGEEARAQQYREIEALLNSQPQVIQPEMDPMTQEAVPDPMTGQPMAPMQLPAIPVDPLLDNHQVHLATIQEWAESDEGQFAKENNPEGYAHVHLHAEQHMQFIQQQQMAAAAQQPGGGGPPPKDEAKPAEAPS